MKKLMVIIVSLVMLWGACATKQTVTKVEKPYDVAGDPLYLTCIQSIIIKLCGEGDEYSRDKMDKIDDYCTRYVRLKRRSKSK